MGGRVRHPEAAAPHSRRWEQDFDGRRVEVVILAELAVLYDPDLEA